MRIDRFTNVPNDTVQKNNIQTKTSSSFQAVLQKSNTRLQLDVLNQLINQIDIQGQKLLKDKTLKNLNEYKKLIKQFVQELVSNGYQLTEKQSFTANGNMKRLQMVEVIDEKLVELQNHVLSQEADRLDTLRLIGEIKGLLINMYM